MVEITETGADDHINKLSQKYVGKPVYAGPDLYAFFAAHQTYITTQNSDGTGDGLHPNDAGQAIERNLWAQSARNVIYR